MVKFYVLLQLVKWFDAVNVTELLNARYLSAKLVAERRGIYLSVKLKSVHSNTAVQ